MGDIKRLLREYTAFRLKQFFQFVVTKAPFTLHENNVLSRVSTGCFGTVKGLSRHFVKNAGKITGDGNVPAYRTLVLLLDSLSTVTDL